MMESFPKQFQTKRLPAFSIYQKFRLRGQISKGVVKNSIVGVIKGVHGVSTISSTLRQ
jgi:hypothetical protein